MRGAHTGPWRALQVVPQPGHLDRAPSSRDFCDASPSSCRERQAFCMCLTRLAAFTVITAVFREWRHQFSVTSPKLTATTRLRLETELSPCSRQQSSAGHSWEFGENFVRCASLINCISVARLTAWHL